MTRWEFHEVVIYRGHESSGGRALEEKGQDGWQIGGVVHRAEQGTVTFYMQRPVQPESADNG
jgi:hypothetical protein